MRRAGKTSAPFVLRLILQGTTVVRERTELRGALFLSSIRQVRQPKDAQTSAFAGFLEMKAGEVVRVWLLSSFAVCVVITTQREGHFFF